MIAPLSWWAQPAPLIPWIAGILTMNMTANMALAAARAGLCLVVSPLLRLTRRRSSDSPRGLYVFLHGWGSRPFIWNLWALWAQVRGWDYLVPHLSSELSAQENAAMVREMIQCSGHTNIRMVSTSNGSVVGILVGDYPHRALAPAIGGALPPRPLLDLIIPEHMSHLIEGSPLNEHYVEMARGYKNLHCVYGNQDAYVRQMEGVRVRGWDHHGISSIPTESDWLLNAVGWLVPLVALPVYWLVGAWGWILPMGVHMFKPVTRAVAAGVLG